LDTFAARATSATVGALDCRFWLVIIILNHRLMTEY